jgi:GNAT superfamily N-acetyltransferase
MRIRELTGEDTAAILEIINASAQAYRGVIPPDRWREPYMRSDELERELGDGIGFWGAEDGGQRWGVIGMRDKGEVALIRHAYVVPGMQKRGVGTSLLQHVQRLIDKPILIGTWADASWAIQFYEKNGFSLVSDSHRDTLLRRYWSIPERQIETSVVLADNRWIRGPQAKTK